MSLSNSVSWVRVNNKFNGKRTIEALNCILPSSLKKECTLTSLLRKWVSLYYTYLGDLYNNSKISSCFFLHIYEKKSMPKNNYKIINNIIKISKIYEEISSNF